MIIRRPTILRYILLTFFKNYVFRKNKTPYQAREGDYIYIISLGRYLAYKSFMPYPLRIERRHGVWVRKAVMLADPMPCYRHGSHEKHHLRMNARVVSGEGVREDLSFTIPKSKTFADVIYYDSSSQHEDVHIISMSKQNLMKEMKRIYKTFLKVVRDSLRGNYGEKYEGLMAEYFQHMKKNYKKIYSLLYSIT